MITKEQKLEFDEQIGLVRLNLELLLRMLKDFGDPLPVTCEATNIKINGWLDVLEETLDGFVEDDEKGRRREGEVMVTKDEMKTMTMDDLVKEHQAIIKRWYRRRDLHTTIPMKAISVIFYLQDIGNELSIRLKARNGTASKVDIEELRVKVNNYDWDD